MLVELHCQRRELQKLNRSLARRERAARAGEHDAAGGEDARARSAEPHLQKANAELAASNRALQAEIAERARAEAALREADRHKDEFLAILAHELRNPLAPIRNAVRDHVAHRRSTIRSWRGRATSSTGRRCT